MDIVHLAKGVTIMVEFMALLRLLWIEHGDTVATVLFVGAFAVMAIMALRKGGATNEAD